MVFLIFPLFIYIVYICFTYINTFASGFICVHFLSRFRILYCVFFLLFASLALVYYFISCALFLLFACLHFRLLSLLFSSLCFRCGFPFFVCFFFYSSSSFIFFFFSFSFPPPRSVLISWGHLPDSSFPALLSSPGSGT